MEERGEFREEEQPEVQIPFCMLIQQIKYKAEEREMEVILVDEDHTSKCLDNEPIEHREYMGRRIRGLFMGGKR